MAQSTLNTFLLPDFISALQPKMEAYQQFGPRPDPVEGLWPGYTCVGKDERNGERVFVLMPQDDCRLAAVANSARRMAPYSRTSSAMATP